VTLLEPDHPTPAATPGVRVRVAELVGIADVGRALRDFRNYLPAHAIQAVVGAIALPILARWLTPSELGVLVLAQALIIFGMVFSSTWLLAALVREVPVHRDAGTVHVLEQTLVRALAVVLAIAFVFTALIAVASIWSEAIRSNLPYIGIGIFATSLHNVAIRLLNSSLRSGMSALFDGLARIASVGIGIGLVLAGYGVHGYLLGLAVAYGSLGIASLWLAWPSSEGSRASAPASSELRGWLRFGLPGSIGILFVSALFLIDRYLLALLKNTHAVGIYTIGNVIGDKAVFIPTTAFAAATGPLLVTAYVEAGRASTERLLAGYLRFALLIGFGLFVVVAVAAAPIVRLLAGGHHYAPAARVVPVVAFGSLLYALGMLASSGLVIARDLRPIAYATGLGLLANVVANLVLIPPFGIDGAAAATPIGMGVFMVAAHSWSRKHLVARISRSTVCRVVAAGVLGGAADAAIATLFGPTPLKIVIGSTIFGLVYLLVLAGLGERWSRERMEPA
jgi:O-antigen/teichoic acid export membrane protein